MATTTTRTNKPLNPRAQDLSPKGYNRASLYSGKALDFDGVNDVVSLDGYTTFTGDFSLSMYIKTSTIAQRGLLCDSANNDGLLLWTTDEELVIRIDGTNYNWNTGLPIYNNHTNNLLLVRSGSEITPYLNGVSGNSVTASSGTFAFNQFGRQTTSANYFDGQASNIKAFNVALTAAQVSDLYLNPEKIVPDGVANSALKLWLPMMEGAGTTAYDGSGNGNDGTISGATWVSGVGAPVAQTALVGWNKGSNLVRYSEQFDNVAWTNSKTTITANAAISPDGYQNADKITITTSGGNNEVYQYIVGITNGYTLSLYAKKDTARWLAFGTNVTTDKLVWFDLENGEVGTTATNYIASIQSVGGGWYRCAITVGTGAAVSPYLDITLTNSDGVLGGALNLSAFVWGAQVTATSDVQPYIPTLATAQTTPVLLPQGLTSGRDITGVNSVSRNAYALNLDGASWAEVHDNASLDFGSGSWSMECWVDWNATLLSDGIMSRWYSSERAPLIYSTSGNGLRVYTGRTSGTADAFVDASSISIGWHHIVANYDSSDTKLRIYIDGNLNATSAAISSAYASNSKSLEIGRLNDDIGGASNAEIALPRIYNRALTATEVSRNYNADKSKFGL